MTVSTSTSFVSYSGNGSNVTFAYPFKIFQDSDLVVTLVDDTTGVVTAQSIVTHYTVTGAGTDAGGNVVFITAPASGKTVKIRRLLAATQETDYVANDPFPAEAHEDALDKLTMLIQQEVADINELSIRFPQDDFNSGVNSILPSVSDRSNKVFAFTSDGGVAVSDNTIAQFDAAVSSFVNATGNNASSILYDPAGAEADQTTVEAKLKEVISVKDFGATGDGVTDDYSAINDAIEYLISLGGGSLYFPQGTYYVTQTLDFFRAPAYHTGFRMIGESRTETIITTDQDIVLIEHAEYFHIENMRLTQTGTAKTGIAIATNAGKQTAYGCFHKLDISGFAYGIWWAYSIWNSVKDVNIGSCGVGIRLSRNQNQDQSNSNDAASGSWNVGWFQNVNTFDNVLVNGGEVGIWATPTGLVMNNVTCQGQGADGSANTVAPVGVPGTGLWLQNAGGGSTSSFGVLGNVVNGYYTEFTRRPIVSEYVPLIVNGAYFQGAGTSGSAYPSVVDVTGATIEFNNCSGSDWFEYQVVADAATVIGSTGGAFSVGPQNLTNDAQNYRNGFNPGGVEYFNKSHTGASTFTVATFAGYNEPVRVDVSGIYDGYLGRSASFLFSRTSGGVTRVQAESNNSSDITGSVSGANIQLSTSDPLAYSLHITITKMRQMTGSQYYPA